jgi:hypothetical protein
MTLTLTKFNLTEMNPSRAIPGPAYTPLPSFVKLGPIGHGRYTNVTFGPNDLDLCRDKPLKGILGSAYTCVPTQ